MVAAAPLFMLPHLHDISIGDVEGLPTIGRWAIPENLLEVGPPFEFFR